MKTCDFGQHVSAYVDGELPIDEVRKIEDHLRTCAECQQELEDHRKLHERLLGASWPEMSQMGIARAKVTIARESFAGLKRMRRIAMGLASMAACLALVTTVLGNRQADTPAPVAWESVALSPSRPAEENSDEMAVAQWVLADLGGVDRD